MDLYMYIYVYVFLYICMYVRMYVCMYMHTLYIYCCICKKWAWTVFICFGLGNFN